MDNWPARGGELFLLSGKIGNEKQFAVFFAQSITWIEPYMIIGWCGLYIWNRFVSGDNRHIDIDKWGLVRCVSFIIISKQIYHSVLITEKNTHHTQLFRSLTSVHNPYYYRRLAISAKMYFTTNISDLRIYDLVNIAISERSLIKQGQWLVRGSPSVCLHACVTNMLMNLNV